MKERTLMKCQKCKNMCEAPIRLINFYEPDQVARTGIRVCDKCYSLIMDYAVKKPHAR